MKVNALFPSGVFVDDPSPAIAFAQGAEAQGCSRIVFHDHVLGAVRGGRARPLEGGPYDEGTPFHEPFVLAAFLAASTTRVGFATNVLVLPQRQVALVAKQVMELDLVSRGRFALGVGIGWNWVEYDALGVRFADRGRVVEEQVLTLRRLWAEPVVTAGGRDFTIERAGISPRSGRSIPIWFGGLSGPAIERCARVGDGFMFGAFGRATLKFAGQLRALVETSGRAADTVGLDVLVDYSDGPEVWRAQLAAWRDIGGTHVTLRTIDDTAEFLRKKRNDFTTVEHHLDALQRFLDVVDEAGRTG